MFFYRVVRNVVFCFIKISKVKNLLERWKLEFYIIYLWKWYFSIFIKFWCLEVSYRFLFLRGGDFIKVRIISGGDYWGLYFRMFIV